MSNYRYFTFFADGQQENYAAQIEGLLAANYSSFTETKANGERTGIYLVTNTAGIRESVAFWKNVQEQTPAFANPANFPWTLSNAPASFFAKALGVKGPVFTMVGKADALAYCFDRAAGDFHHEVIDSAWIIGIHQENEKLEIGIFFATGVVDMKEIAHLATVIRLPEILPLNPDAVSSMQQVFLPVIN